jgi:hypothetical protein
MTKMGDKMSNPTAITTKNLPRFEKLSMIMSILNSTASLSKRQGAKGLKNA